MIPLDEEEVNSTNAVRTSWTSCPACQGRGQNRRKLAKKEQICYQNDRAEFNKNNTSGLPPARPLGSLYACTKCSGSGLSTTENQPEINTENYPHVAIIGGGIGGAALAVACLHRGIPFTLYERDPNFEARSQGYGLTLQQASNAIKGLGITSLDKGVVSTKHIVHATDGTVLGEWGMRKWAPANHKKSAKRTNIHIARQSLRLAILDVIGAQDKIKWGHQLVDLKNKEGEGVTLTFEVNGQLQHATADLVVGADGIRSTVRRLALREDNNPLRFLDCIVILGICSLEALQHLESPLLDSATVFQTANGTERIYIMPYDKDSVMWQLSFPMLEEEAKELSALGPKYLKQEAIRRTQWHSPIPEILETTPEELVSGYPVYDREILSAAQLENAGAITLIGDAAHPMSPFKGQGANQALLDALALARAITRGSQEASHWKKIGVRNSILANFEAEMIKRTAVKVKDSATAAAFLHTENVLQESNSPRGKGWNNEE